MVYVLLQSIPIWEALTNNALRAKMGSKHSRKPCYDHRRRSVEGVRFVPLSFQFRFSLSLSLSLSLFPPLPFEGERDMMKNVTDIARIAHKRGKRGKNSFSSLIHSFFVVTPIWPDKGKPGSRHENINNNRGRHETLPDLVFTLFFPWDNEENPSLSFTF